MNLLFLSSVLRNPTHANRFRQFQAQQLLIGLEQIRQVRQSSADKGLGQHAFDMADGIHAALTVVASGLLPKGCQLLIVFRLYVFGFEVLLEAEGAVAGGLEQVRVLLGGVGRLDDAVHIVDGLVLAGAGAQRRRALEADDAGLSEKQTGGRRGNARVGGLFSPADGLDGQHLDQQAGDIELGGIRHDAHVFLAGEDAHQFFDRLFDLFALFLGHFPLCGLGQCEDFHHAAVLLQALRVGAAAALEADGVHRRGDFRLERVVRALGTVRNHQLSAVGQRGQHGQHGLGQRSDLVGLDEGGVDLAVLGAVLDVRVLRGDQVVADDEDLVAQFFHQVLPALVVAFAEAVFDGEDRDVLFHGLLVEVQDLVAAHLDLALVAPETVDADGVGLAPFFPIGIFELGAGRVQGDGHIDARDVLAVEDRLLHHAPHSLLGHLVGVCLVDVGRNAAFEADTHDLGARRGLDDLLQTVLELHGHFLGVFVGLGRQGHEHAFLHADVALGVLLLRVAAAHGAVAELPRGGDPAAVFERDGLHPRREQRLLELCHPGGPAFAGGSDGGGPCRGFGGRLLADAELAELAGVGQQPVQQADAAGGQEESAYVNEEVDARGQSDGDEYDSSRQAHHRQVSAPDRRGGRHGQVIRGVGGKVTILFLDAIELAPGNQQEHLRVPAGLVAALQGGVRLLLRVLVQGRQLRGGQEVPHFMDGDGDVPRQIQNGQRNPHFYVPRREHEVQHHRFDVLAFGGPLGQLGGRQAEDRRNEGGVEGHQFMVRDHPAAFQIACGIDPDPRGPDRRSAFATAHFHC